MLPRLGAAAVAAVAATALLLSLSAWHPTSATGAQPRQAAPAAAPAMAPAAAEDDWLHTEGNQIVDADGNKVWLTGANWFGFNATERVFHGLWSANMETLTKSMSERGVNIVRVPISTQLLLEWRDGGAAVSSAVNTFVNPELEGKTTLQVFDAWLALCERYGLKVMLDVHSAEADNAGHVYPVWWKGAITPELFYQAWEWVADRYRTNDTIVAMDVKNEPHGGQGDGTRAKWDGSTDQDNFKHACQTAGRRILAVNPNVLVLCEGVEIYPRDGTNWSSTTGTDYHHMWWGGNLRGVRDHPVDLGADQDQLVYSPHDYGPLVFQQPWFEGDWDRTTLERDVWDPNWLYIHKENRAPLLIGEWGGFLDGGPNEKWMNALRDLITENGIHQTFWCLNPNSGDTGGLLLNDWATWDEAKYALLKPALWQHEGRFVSLDHQVRLGGAASTTGISLADLYGGGDDGPPPDDDPDEPAELSVRYRNNDGSPSDNAIRPGLQLVNTGTAPVDLADVTLRYYFTRDGGSDAVSAWCDYAAVGCGTVSTDVVPLADPVGGADAYLEVSFSSGALAAGANTGDIQLRMSKADWSPFDETDDYSHSTATSYTDSTAITAHTAGSRVWGTEPG